MKKICRFCTYYRPDARYQGVIGVCEANDRQLRSVKDECEKFKEGRQRTLQGDEVNDEQENGKGVRRADEE